MDEEKNLEQTNQPEKPSYTPASRGKRIAAWIGVILMIALVLLYSYSIATGSFLKW